MTYVLLTQLCLLMVSCLLKTAFWPWRRKAVLIIVYATIVFINSSLMGEVSGTSTDTLIHSRAVRLDWTILVLLESLIIIVYCFAVNRWQRILSYYPGLLALATICYLQMQVLITIPGISFTTFGWYSTTATIVLLSLGSLLTRWGTHDRDTATELLFITQLLIIILCILFTGII